MILLSTVSEFGESIKEVLASSTIILLITTILTTAKSYITKTFQLSETRPHSLAGSFTSIAYYFAATTFSLSIKYVGSRDVDVFMRSCFLFAAITMSLGPFLVLSPTEKTILKKETFFKKLTRGAQTKEARTGFLMIFIVITIMQGCVVFSLWHSLNDVLNLDLKITVGVVVGYSLVCLFYLVIFYSVMMEKEVVIGGVNLMDQLRRKLIFRKKDGTKIEILATKIYRNIYLFLFAIVGLLALAALIYTFVEEVKSFMDLTNFGKAILLFFTLLNLLGLVTYCGFILNVAFHPAKTNEVDLGGGVTVAENRIKYVAIGRSSDRTLLARFIAPDDPDSWCIETVVKRDIKTTDTTPGYRRVRKCAKYALFQENDCASMYFVGTGPQYPNNLAWFFIDKIQFKISDDYYEKGIENYLTYATGSLSQPLNKHIEDLAKEFSTEKEWGDLNQQQHKKFWEHKQLNIKHKHIQKSVSLRNESDHLNKLIKNSYKMETLILHTKEKKHQKKILNEREEREKEKRRKIEEKKRTMLEEKKRLEREMGLLEKEREREKLKTLEESTRRRKEGSKQREMSLFDQIRSSKQLKKVEAMESRFSDSKSGQSIESRLPPPPTFGRGRGGFFGGKGRGRGRGGRGGLLGIGIPPPPQMGGGGGEISNFFSSGQQQQQQERLPELSNLLASSLSVRRTVIDYDEEEEEEEDLEWSDENEKEQEKRSKSKSKWGMEKKKEKKDKIPIQSRQRIALDKELDESDDESDGVDEFFDKSIEKNEKPKEPKVESTQYGGYDPTIEDSIFTGEQEYYAMRSNNLMDIGLEEKSMSYAKKSKKKAMFSLPSLSVPSVNLPSVKMPNMKIGGFSNQKSAMDDIMEIDISSNFQKSDLKFEALPPQPPKSNDIGFNLGLPQTEIQKESSKISRKMPPKPAMKKQRQKKAKMPMKKKSVQRKKKKRISRRREEKKEEKKDEEEDEDDDDSWGEDSSSGSSSDFSSTEEEKKKSEAIKRLIPKKTEEQRKLEEKMKKLDEELIKEESSELSFDASEDETILLLNKNQGLAQKINNLSRVEKDYYDPLLKHTKVSLMEAGYITPRYMSSEELKEKDENLDKNFGSELNPKIILESYNDNEKYDFLNHTIKIYREDKKLMREYEIGNRKRLFETFPVEKYLEDELKKKNKGKLEMDTKEKYDHVRKGVLGDLIKRTNKIMEESQRKSQGLNRGGEFHERINFENYFNPVLGLLKGTSRYIEVNKKIDHLNNSKELIEYRVKDLPQKSGFITIYSQNCLPVNGSGCYIWEMQFTRIVPKAAIKVGVTPKLSEIIKSQRKLEKRDQKLENYREKLDSQIELGDLPGSYAINGVGDAFDNTGMFKFCSEFNANDKLTFCYNSDLKYLALAKNGRYLGKLGFNIINDLYFAITFYSRSIKVNQLILNREKKHFPVTFGCIDNTFGNIYINRFCDPKDDLLGKIQTVLNSSRTFHGSQGNFFFKKMIASVFSRFVSWVHPFVKKILIGNTFLSVEEQINIKDYALLAKNRIKLYFIICYGADNKERNEQMYTFITEFLFFINLYATWISAPNAYIASKIIQHNLADRYHNSLIDDEDNKDQNILFNHLITQFDEIYKILSKQSSKLQKPYLNYSSTGSSSTFKFMDTNHVLDKIVFPNEGAKI
ncbi:a-type inclusion protein [Anaeramoeba flamelloides]|uniref:A-type inclusion protein n=1 Tax=Anaeramoeba flamelloides TaxID=1746091 RepID=A0AAV7Y6H3_9EUKA|nr:a-type inclusion protein [Anaeramoeba flamelloides]